MKQYKFILTLLMAIVMMAISPQRIWADGETVVEISTTAGDWYEDDEEEFFDYTYQYDKNNVSLNFRTKFGEDGCGGYIDYKYPLDISVSEGYIITEVILHVGSYEDNISYLTTSKGTISNDGDVTATVSGISSQSLSVSISSSDIYIDKVTVTYKSADDSGASIITITALSGNPNSSNEGYANLFDGSNSTKWCGSSNESAGCYTIFKISQRKAITGYTLIDGGDTDKYTGRHWKAWKIYGANFTFDADATKDASEWVEVDSQSGSNYDSSNQSSFTVSNANAYQYYKIVVTEVGETDYKELDGLDDDDNPIYEYVHEYNMQQMADVKFTWGDGPAEDESQTKLQSFELAITQSGASSAALSKSEATSITLEYNNNAPKVTAKNGEEDATPASLLFTHGVRYDFKFSTGPSIGKGDGTLDGDLVAGTKRRLAAQASISTAELTGPALVLVGATASPYYLTAENNSITLGINEEDKYVVNGTVVDGTVTEVYYFEPHTFVEGENGFCHVCSNAYQPATAVYKEGSTTEVDYYAISNAGQLYWFADKVNNDNDNYRSAKAQLTANITVNQSVLKSDGTLNGDGSNLRKWTPIGKDNRYSFYGNFNGDGHTISGLYANSNEEFLGLIGICQGNISHVGVIDYYLVSGYSSSGTICAELLNSNISDCYAIGTIRGERYAGGICGQNRSGTIKNCYATGSVSGRANVGGLCGFNNSKIINCYTTNTTAIGEASSSATTYAVEGDVPLSRFTSGEIAWYLNGVYGFITSYHFYEGPTNGTQKWYQTIDSDTYPHFAKATDGSNTVRRMFDNYTNSKTVEVPLTTVGSYGYTSLYTNFNYTCNVPVYYASGYTKDNGVTMVQFPNNEVSYKQGAIIRAQGADKAVLTYSDEAFDIDAEATILRGTDEQSTGDADCYTFAMRDGIIGFYSWNGKTLPAWKTYILIYNETGAKGFSLHFDDEESTSIENVTSSSPLGELDGASVYNLQGQKLSAPLKGINIVNGKKVMVK